MKKKIPAGKISLPPNPKKYDGPFLNPKERGSLLAFGTLQR